MARQASTIIEVYRAALLAGFTPQRATTWTAIALAESGGDPAAHNSVGEDSRGLWQINLDAHSARWGGADLNDPEVNARAAYEISRGGTDMRPWTVTHDVNKGTARDYRSYLDEVEALTGFDGDDRGVSGYQAAVPTPLADTSAGARESELARTESLVGGGAESIDVDTIDEPPPGAQDDADQDGLVDAYERLLGTDLQEADTDMDGLSDAYEVGVSASNPMLADSDADGLSDSTEAALGTGAMSWDTDEDGLSDRVEQLHGTDSRTADAGEGLVLPDELPEPEPEPTEVQAMGGPLAPVRPVEGTLTADFGEVTSWHPNGHGGVDFGAAEGTPVVAPLGGHVEFAGDGSQGESWAYGNYVKIVHEDGTSTMLAHLNSLDVEPGDVVVPGQQVGTVGSTGRSSGPHLHWETRDEANQRLDPEEWFTEASTAQAGIGGDVDDPENPQSRSGEDDHDHDHDHEHEHDMDQDDAVVDDDTDGRPRYEVIDYTEGAETPADQDQDGLSDAFEELAGTDPNLVDSDMDGLDDAAEAIRYRTDPLSADTDADGISDATEIAMGEDPGQIPGIAGVAGHGEFAQVIRDGPQDADLDGLSDHYEQQLGLDPESSDTDLDGLSDSTEIAMGTDPTSLDTDLDGFNDAFELSLGRDPLGADDALGTESPLDSPLGESPLDGQPLEPGDATGDVPQDLDPETILADTSAIDDALL